MTRDAVSYTSIVYPATWRVGGQLPKLWRNDWFLVGNAMQVSDVRQLDPEGNSDHLAQAAELRVMALDAADKGEKYKTAIKNAAKYLREYQWDESRGKQEDSDYYGGAGYAGDKSRPDLSNTAFFLEALKTAGVEKEDPAFKKALVFVGRCQNLDSEFNKAPWAKKNNDGSVMYTGANGGENRRTDGEGTKTDMGGYGSMTYAGIKSMI
ncbi:MAG: hypothetical protein ACK5MY_00370, partial [Jhaorihella sp.]